MSIKITGSAISIRDDILSNIETVLKTISTANGYNTDVQVVSRQVQSFDQCPSFPALYIVSGDERREYGGSATDRVVSFWEVIITCYIKSESELSIQQEKLISDVTNAMALDCGRGTNSDSGDPNALDTRVTSIRDYQQAFSPVGIMDILYEISYPHLEIQS